MGQNVLEDVRWYQRCHAKRARSVTEPTNGKGWLYMTVFPRFKVLKPLVTRGGITRFSVVWLCSPRALLAVTGWMAQLLRDEGVSLRCGGGHVSCGPAGKIVTF